MLPAEGAGGQPAVKVEGQLSVGRGLQVRQQTGQQAASSHEALKTLPGFDCAHDHEHVSHPRGDDGSTVIAVIRPAQAGQCLGRQGSVAPGPYQSGPVDVGHLKSIQGFLCRNLQHLR